ncbi:amidohydrolase [uncultured Desulfuromusa sp.]|uniref:amidohydrolase n=1 Tax=uncultured Desulfuromusa sp. TaxID=219183 RepID=UPI002AA60A7F|nr:amidohydrolase [uncultured Desulfuromusa sp.]
MNRAIELRHQLHQNPELSGGEAKTAERIIRFFTPLCPEALIKKLGGNGIAVVFSGNDPGPTVLLRAELDALPIQETIDGPYRSIYPNISHKCGHDGHMAILAAVGIKLAAKRPLQGRVVLLFQPAEETGAGAAAVIADPRYAEIAPDLVFALHNLPGFPLGQVVIRDGTFASASRGITIKLSGATAHAAQPETGCSPALAMAQIITRLSGLSAQSFASAEAAFVTIVGAQLGSKSFGTAPGKAEIWATLRSETDAVMESMIAETEQIISAAAFASSLDYSINYSDIFQATVNSQSANDVIRSSCRNESVVEPAKPFRWSEDFGCFTSMTSGALFGIGAGKGSAELHNSHYDFPDALIEPAAQLFCEIIDRSLG